MAGHSKWAQIKHAKAVTDHRRGKLFTRLAREVIVAARQGGGDPDANFRLRMAVQRAKDANMPNDNIERAIKRGTGESDDGVQMIEAIYEGYGPGGVAIMLETLTDNRNRTVSDVRTTLTRAGGNLAESGAVSWQFEKKGVITVDAPQRRRPKTSRWSPSTPERTISTHTTRPSSSSPRRRPLKRCAARLSPKTPR